MFRLNNRRKCLDLFETYYAGRKFSDAFYREAIRRYLQPGQRLLDAGCGRHLTFSWEFAEWVKVVGLDLETTLKASNHCSPFAVCGDVTRLPFASERFDLVISRSVVEHLPDPPAAFGEFCRVLKPGGKVIVLTPNRWDYVSAIASVTPHRFHQKLVSRLCNVAEDDVFPTHYRANTAASLRRAFRSAGLVERELQAINHYPAYLMFSPVLFRLGVLYERITSLRPFRALRGSFLCVFEKPAPARNLAANLARKAQTTQDAPAEVR